MCGLLTMHFQRSIHERNMFEETRTKTFEALKNVHTAQKEAEKSMFGGIFQRPAPVEPIRRTPQTPGATAGLAPSGQNLQFATTAFGSRDDP